MPAAIHYSCCSRAGRPSTTRLRPQETCPCRALSDGSAPRRTRPWCRRARDVGAHRAERCLACGRHGASAARRAFRARARPRPPRAAPPVSAPAAARLAVKTPLAAPSELSLFGAFSDICVPLFIVFVVSCVCGDKLLKKLFLLSTIFRKPCNCSIV